MTSIPIAASLVLVAGASCDQHRAPRAKAGSDQQDVPSWTIDPQHPGQQIPFHDEHASPATTPPPGLYVALGDSITYGLGVTNRCQSFPAAPVDIESACPDGTSYPVLVAKQLRKAGVAGHFMNLGTVRATVDTVLDKELPYLPADATIVTLHIGTNDIHLVQPPQSVVADVVKSFETKYDELLAGIHARAPGARIIIIDVPNQKGFAIPQHRPADVVARYDEASRAIDKFIDAHAPQYRVVSTVCNPKSYDMTLQFNNSVHPNEAGTPILAQEVADVILARDAPAPPTTCDWL